MLHKIDDELTLKVRGKLHSIEKSIITDKVKYTFISDGIFIVIDEDVLEKIECERELLAEA